MLLKKTKAWGLLFSISIVCIVLVMFFYHFLIGQFVVFSGLLISMISATMIIEAFSIKTNRGPSMLSHQQNFSEYPDATAVIFAYLPNEQSIIMQTITHFLKKIQYPGHLQVLLAYNSPIKLSIEDQLEMLAEKNPRFQYIHIENSLRKATNLNTVLNRIATPIVGLFDADSRPERDCFKKVAGWFAEGFDFIQGSNSISNSKNNLLTLIINVEFFLKYFGSYVGRYHSFGVTYFSGSNGYWRSEILKKTCANELALAEDIDMAIRALLFGAKLAYDENIRAYDEAPSTITAWWRQRVRWAQGWTQLFDWYQIDILKTNYLSMSKKIIWTVFLFGRRFILPISVIILFIGVSLKIFFRLPFTNFEIVLLLLYVCLQTGAVFYMSIKCYKNFIVCKSENRFFFKDILLYSLIFPFYDILRSITIVQGTFALLKNPKKWHCTPRDYKSTDCGELRVD